MPLHSLANFVANYFAVILQNKRHCVAYWHECVAYTASDTYQYIKLGADTLSQFFVSVHKVIFISGERLAKGVRHDTRKMRVRDGGLSESLRIDTRKVLCSLRALQLGAGRMPKTDQLDTSGDVDGLPVTATVPDNAQTTHKQDNSGTDFQNGLIWNCIQQLSVWVSKGLNVVVPELNNWRNLKDE